MRRRQNTDIILAIEYDTTNIEVKNVITSLTTAVPHVGISSLSQHVAQKLYAYFLFLLY